MSGRQECKVFVGGLSWETTDVKLKQYFENFGSVQEAFVSYDRNTGRPRGFGFVVFVDPLVADKVVAQQHTIDRREVEAKKALPKEESPVSKDLQAVASGQRTKKIFVGGLAGTVDEPAFREYFESFGTVDDAVVMYDYDNKRPRGFGFITFAEEEAVEAVFANGKLQTIHEKQIEIKRAIPRDTGPYPSPKALYRPQERQFGFMTPTPRHPSMPHEYATGSVGMHPIQGIDIPSGVLTPGSSDRIQSPLVHGSVVTGIPASMMHAVSQPVQDPQGLVSEPGITPINQSVISISGSKGKGSIQPSPLLTPSDHGGSQATPIQESYGLGERISGTSPLASGAPQFPVEPQPISNVGNIAEVRNPLSMASVSEALEQYQQERQQGGSGLTGQPESSQGTLWN
eukprot:jgi/Picsp_1/78/NSC_00078-R1_heterogeneous nuclear ribonucleoprotein a2 b1-like protein